MMRAMRWDLFRKHFVGQAKIHSKIKKSFDIRDSEEGVFSKWENLGLFKPAHDKNCKYSMLLPPPNVTGTLHLGHALTVTCQDVIARWQRMKGMSVIWVPGVDHAGIATQAVVERVLGGRPGRQELNDALQNWSESSTLTIKSQLKRLGASLYWPAFYYTLDEMRTKAVQEAFLRLWKAGLVERKEALVNWSPALGSTLSDIEVNHLPIQGPTPLTVPGYEKPVVFGQLFHFAYPLDDGGEIVVATTRPETMLGDQCVCVHPSDSHYSYISGHKIIHPFTGAHIPVLADEAVDPDFGTGALKVTPAHDSSDFEIALRHNLPVIPVIGEDGCINHQGAQFQGMKRFDARIAVIEALSAKGLLRKIEDHIMEVPLCSRSMDVIELLPKQQWFIKCSELSKNVVEKVKTGDLRLVPEDHIKTFLNYMENIRDWCVSRQVLWGHQVPLSWSPCQEAWVPSDSTDPCLQPDPDVLDTWFSSSLLPFSAFGWPNQTEELAKYYPLDVMVTGHDIVFFWVARMAMMGLALTDQLPFKKVILHGIVCDADGRKMSKSIGNVIDPQHIIDGVSLQDLRKELMNKVETGRLSKGEGERAAKHFTEKFPQGIPSCGTDALRITLMATKIKKHFVEFDVAEAAAARVLCNKVWQACRFLLNFCDVKELDRKSLSDIGIVAIASGLVDSSPVDRWMACCLGRTILGVNRAIQDADFHVAVAVLRQFIVSELCDVYIEWCKAVRLNRQEKAELSLKLLVYSFKTSLRLLAPFAPFVSDHLYCHLSSESTSIHSTPFPSFPEDLRFDASLEEQFTMCFESIKEIRRLKSITQTELSFKLKVGLMSAQECDWKDYLLLMRTLTKADVSIINKSDLKDSDWVLKATVGVNTRIYLPSKVIQTRESTEQIVRRREKLEKELVKILKVMEHESYKEKVKDTVKKTHNEKILKIRTELERLNK